MVKYEIQWNDGTDPALIERHMIKCGGEWTENGRKWGNGLIFHFKEYWKLLWPDDSQTWWTDLMIKEIMANQFSSLVGPASAGKTGQVSRIAMMDWSCYPSCTTVIVSSITMDDVRNRVFGEIQKLWNIAKKGHPWFPGFPVDSKAVITETEAGKDEARDIRNSIVGVPCKKPSGQFMGMGRFAGRKNHRMWCIGDEFQYMQVSILQAQNNLIANGPNLVPGMVRERGHPDFGKPLRGYKCVFIGNPNPSASGNPLELVSEPEMGWSSIAEDDKTKVWDCKKLSDYPVKCRCINLDSLDSPNAAFPLDNPRWVHMAGPHKLSLYTEGSEAYWTQGRGVFRFGLTKFKIITKEICDAKKAFDRAVWKGTARTKIGMVDAAYGGGDRCMLGWLEFGPCVDEKQRLEFQPYMEIPVKISKELSPEDQIAIACRDKMVAVGVAPENFFFDGRGSLAMAFAQHWSPMVNAVEFGGRPTERPAGPDIYMLEKLTTGGVSRRIKTAVEHYSNFVTELWWSVRYCVEADQVRGMQVAAVLDGQPREWKKVAGDKMKAEPKDEMKVRTGVSPDVFDMYVVGVEGARRRGFQISNLAGTDQTETDLSWLDKLKEKQKHLRRDHELTHT
jgi:hypothetical protein